MDEALASLGRLRRERCPRQRCHEVGGKFDGVDELSLRRARVCTAATDCDPDLPGRERLDLELADPRAVERVCRLSTEGLEVK